MSLDFGVKVRVSNFYVLKFSRSLTGKEMKALRASQSIPVELHKYLNRASLPYIKVSTISGSWSVEFVAGTSMYNALDNLTVVGGSDGTRHLAGVEKKNVEAIFTAMFADTTTVGDTEYQVSKQKLLCEYLDRASKEAVSRDANGKSEEQLRKESDDAVQEVIDRDKHAAMFDDMADRIAREESSHD